MGWFSVPWASVIGLLVALGIGGVLCFIFAFPLFPAYAVLAAVIAIAVLAFVVFVQFLPVILPLLLVGVLLYMFAVKQGWIPRDLAYRAVRYGVRSRSGGE